MTEILTESFCERCGTRYTFESAAPRQKRLGGFKTLGRGLKNFVLSDDSSLDEAMAAARSDTERESTTQQLDAFHRTFNFCMSCRQYTCANCWNGVEARCLSCAPMAGVVDFEETVAEPDLERLLRLTAPPSETAQQDGHVHEHIHEPLGGAPAAADGDAQAAEPPWPGGAGEVAGLPAWAAAAGIQLETPGEVAEPADDAEAFEDVLTAADLEARLGAAPVEAGPAPRVAAEEVDASGGEPSVQALEAATIDAAAGAPETVAEPVQAEAAPIEAIVEPVEAGLAGLEPGESLEDAIAAYEASLAAEPVEAEPDEPVFTAEPDEAPLATVPGEAALAEEPVAAESAAAVAQLDEAAHEAASRDAFFLDDNEAAARPRVDVVEQPTWPVAPLAAPEPEPVAPEAVASEVAPEPAAEPEPVAAAEALPDVAPAPTPAPPALQPVVPALPASPADAPTGPPQWPTGPRWPTAIPARQAPSLPGPDIDPLTAIMARQATEAMWAASSRDVVQPPLAAAAPTAGVQPCVSCGISLSANARFCRRCGTSQVG